jgi:lipopolysaccharide transport system ATP-binding protein
MAPAVAVRGLSKRYRVDARASTGVALRRGAAQLARRPSSGGAQHIWALDDVSFDVAPGEALGIIGRNGAGKSTLLKILSRITDPTRGTAELRGRVGSLLEIGTGFHPELTGRENVYLNGAILGMRRREIARKFDEIVAFSEVEQFLDTPVKWYSSGMAVRLAFAVAAHLDLEIMVVDEVLAVGDVAFQRKCLGKMGDVSAGGRAVLFVSHLMPAVTQLCERGVLLSEGRVVTQGPINEVVSEYIRSISAEGRAVHWDEPGEAPGSERLRLRSARTAESAAGGGTFTVNEPVPLELDYWVLREGLRAMAGFMLRDASGALVFMSGSFHEGEAYAPERARGVYRSSVVIPAPLLNEGTYTVDVIMGVFGQDPDVFIPGAVSFDVLDDGADSRAGAAAMLLNYGAVRPRLSWSTTEVAE